MAKKIQIVNAILCDFVGRGYSNKHILVNAIAGNVRVSSFPADVGFGIFIELDVRKSRPEKLVFEIAIDGERAIQGAGDLTSMGASEISASIVIPRFDFRLEKESLLEVILTAEGFPPTTAISKMISLSPDPSNV
jgi:hypothetical protein